jgi:hypothetical protein
LKIAVLARTSRKRVRLSYEGDRKNSEAFIAFLEHLAFTIYPDQRLISKITPSEANVVFSP